MSEAIIIVSFAVLFVASLIGAICASSSQTFTQKHPLINAAFKGLIFYSFLGAIYAVVQLIFPSFISVGFLFGSFIGSIGGAVFGYRVLLESQTENRKAQRENNLKTLPN